MITNIEKVYEDAMQLSNEYKAQLAERIVNFLETHIDPQVESAHLDIVEQRKNEIKNGRVKGVDAQDVSVMARRVIDL